MAVTVIIAATKHLNRIDTPKKKKLITTRYDLTTYPPVSDLEPVPEIGLIT
jgi:hypothetical protein